MKQTMVQSASGPKATFVYSVIISLSALGALNANVFATGRLCVAACRRRYFPKILGNMHVEDHLQEQDYYEKHLSTLPSLLKSGIKAFAKWTARLRLEEEVPV